jgi:hypothetical protein
MVYQMNIFQEKLIEFLNEIMECFDDTIIIQYKCSDTLNFDFLILLISR